MSVPNAISEEARSRLGVELIAGITDPSAIRDEVGAGLGDAD